MRAISVALIVGAALAAAGCKMAQQESATETAAGPVGGGQQASADAEGAAPRREPCGDGPIILPTDEERAFAASIAGRLARWRYMDDVCTPGTFPGWERLPLMRCSYSQTNSDGTKRAGTVILLDPSPEQLAQWIFSSCRAIDKDNAVCRSKLFQQASVSSGHFPVAGVVIEDQIPKGGDGRMESYTFRTGVTVRLQGVPNGTLEQLSPEEIAAALSPETPISSSRKWARIVSTGAGDYRADGGTADVGTDNNHPSLNWPAVAGALYRDAWGSPNNELMTAWARAHKE